MQVIHRPAKQWTPKEYQQIMMVQIYWCVSYSIFYLACLKAPESPKNNIYEGSGPPSIRRSSGYDMATQWHHQQYNLLGLHRPYATSYLDLELRLRLALLDLTMAS
jgi:hypothetical protein